MKIFITLFLAVLCALPTSVIEANAQTRDTWRSVRTNNLFVISNADAEKLRQVAVWLEFFHGAFGRLVSRNVIDSSIPTTVILFRDDASFTPFKPLYHGRPANVAGYFQAGDDVNYIAISLDATERDPYSTAFHEYIHVHVNDNIPGAPLWLNEGLAEFYGSLQFSSGEALLGAPLMYYIRYLRQQELLPLSTLFSIGTNSEHYNEADKTGIFYGQSWALVHYLMLGDRGRQEQFKRFLQLVTRGDSSPKAIESAYGVTLPVLEQELRAYIRRGEFSSLRIASGDNPEAYAAYTAMQRTALSEGEANHYLGDLLLHIGRPNENHELLAVQREADFYGPMRLKSVYKKVTLAGTSKIGYRDVYVLELQPAAGAADRLYLDAKTYLPVRMNTVETLGTGAVPVEIYLDDWREVDGIKFPFSISRRLAKRTLSLTVKEIRHNVPMDARIFGPN